MRRVLHLYGAGAAVAALAACAMPPIADAPVAVQRQAEPAPSRAAAVAIDLAASADAYAARDGAALEGRLGRLRNRGVRPLDPAAQAMFDTWLAAAPDAPPPLRGRLLGPGFLRGTLGPNERRATSQLFLAGKPSEIAVAGGTRQALRLRLLNAKGQAICEQDPATGRSCRFTPIFTQRYAIEITNRGAEDAIYFLVFD